MKRFGVWMLVFLIAIMAFGYIAPGFAQTQEENSISGASGRSVRNNVFWASWTWTAPTAGPVTLDTQGSDFDLLLMVSDGAAILPIVTNINVDGTFSSEIRFTAQQGQMYGIIASRADGSLDPGTIVLNWQTSSASNGNDGGTHASADDSGLGLDVYPTWSPPEDGAASHGLGTMLSYVVAGTTDVLAEIEYLDYTMHNGRWVLVVFNDAPAPENSTCHGATHEYWDLETGNWVACLRDGELLGELTPHLGFFQFPMTAGGKWSQTMSWTDHVNPANSSSVPFSHTYAVEACGIEVKVPVGEFTTCRVKFVEASYSDIVPQTQWYDPNLDLVIKTQVDGVVYELWNYALEDDNSGGNIGGRDNFGSSTAISGASGRSEGSNVGAGKESGEPDHVGNSGGASVWWTWTAPVAGLVTFDTQGSDFDTLLAVYTGDSLNRLAEIAVNEDADGDPPQSVVRFSTRQGQTYHIAVDGYGGKTGVVVLNWQVSSTFIASAETSISGPDGLTAIGRDITWTAPPPKVAGLDKGWNYVRNSNGDLHGLQIHVDGMEVVAERWVNGVRQTRASYRDGEPFGEFASFANGKLDGVQYWIDENSWSFQTFRDGISHGAFGSYLDEEPEGDFGTFSDGELDGAVHTISRAGWHFETWRDGTRHGPYGSYNPNGQKHGLIGVYTDDRKDKGEVLYVRDELGQGGNGNRPPEPVGTKADLTLTRGVKTLVVMAPYFTDPDDEPPAKNLFYSAQSDDTSVARVGCGFHCTIRPVFGGTATITVTATDTGGLTAVQKFMVTVPANRPPIPMLDNVPEEITFSRRSTETLHVDTIFERFLADPDGDALIYNYLTEPPGLLSNPLPFHPDGFGGDPSGTTRLDIFAPQDDAAVATVIACDRGVFHRGTEYIPHPERLCESLDFTMIVQSDFTDTSPGNLSVEAPYCTDPLVNVNYPTTEVEICARDLDYEDGDGVALRLLGNGVIDYDDYPYNCDYDACLDFDPLSNSMSCKTVRVQGSIVEIDYELRPRSQRSGWWGWDTDRPLCEAGQSPDCFVGPELFDHPGEDVNRGELTIRTRTDSDTGEWRSKTSHINHSSLEGQIRIVAVESDSPEHCAAVGTAHELPLLGEAHYACLCGQWGEARLNVEDPNDPHCTCGPGIRQELRMCAYSDDNTLLAPTSCLEDDGNTGRWLVTDVEARIVDRQAAIMDEERRALEGNELESPETLPNAGSDDELIGKPHFFCDAPHGTVFVRWEPPKEAGNFSDGSRATATSCIVKWEEGDIGTSYGLGECASVNANEQAECYQADRKRLACSGYQAWSQHNGVIIIVRGRDKYEPDGSYYCCTQRDCAQ